MDGDRSRDIGGAFWHAGAEADRDMAASKRKQTGLKTQPSADSVERFIAGIAEPEAREDCHALVELMSRATGAKPVMYGKAIVGFGQSKIKYADGREMDWMQIGFSPRKAALTLYLGAALDDGSLLDKLGKYKRGKGCLYIRRLSEVDAGALRKLIALGAKRR
jgi:hypothetical protein